MAVTCHHVVLFSNHVTHVVVFEQLFFLLFLFLQDFLSITWAMANQFKPIYFLNRLYFRKCLVFLILLKPLDHNKAKSSGWTWVLFCFFKILDQIIYALKNASGNKIRLLTLWVYSWANLSANSLTIKSKNHHICLLCYFPFSFLSVFFFRNGVTIFRTVHINTQVYRN